MISATGFANKLSSPNSPKWRVSVIKDIFLLKNFQFRSFSFHNRFCGSNRISKSATNDNSNCSALESHRNIQQYLQISSKNDNTTNSSSSSSSSSCDLRNNKSIESSNNDGSTGKDSNGTARTARTARTATETAAAATAGTTITQAATAVAESAVEIVAATGFPTARLTHFGATGAAPPWGSLVTIPKSLSIHKGLSCYNTRVISYSSQGGEKGEEQIGGVYSRYLPGYWGSWEIIYRQFSGWLYIEDDKKGQLLIID